VTGKSSSLLHKEVDERGLFLPFLSFEAEGLRALFLGQRKKSQNRRSHFKEREGMQGPPLFSLTEWE